MASENKTSLRREWKEVRKVCSMLYELDRWCFFLSALAALLEVAVQYLALLLTAWALTQSAYHTDWHPLIQKLFLFVAVIFAVHICAGFLKKEVEVRQETISYRFQNLISEKIMQMDFSVADSPNLRKLRDRIRKDNNFGQGIYWLCWFFNFCFMHVFRVLGAVIIIVPVLKEIFVQKSLSAVFLLVLGVVVMVIFSDLWMKEETAYREKNMNDMFDTPQEMAQKADLTEDFADGTLFSWQSGKDVRIYDGAALFEEYTFGRVERYERDERRKIGRMFRDKERNFYFGQQLLAGMSYFIVGYVAMGGSLEIGSLTKYAGAMGNFFGGLSMLRTYLFNISLSSRRQLSSLELLQTPDEMYKGKLPVEKRSDFEYEIEFSHVWFRYPGAEGWALRDFSFKLKVGKKLAIVGMNGSGKTTMIKLLCRLYEPTQGEILLNGVDIRKFEEDEYRRLFSVVFQDLSLFSLKLGENVAGSEEYDAEKVKKCLQDAGFGERLERLPEGLESYLYKDFEDSGVDISGGEAQKIAIARALYKDAPFILLDEPTAALDPKAEYEIYTSFDKMVGKKTAIYISHRLSSCRFCDDIAVFDQGRLVQRGGHEELVADQKGKYFELWTAQAQYYQ